MADIQPPNQNDSNEEPLIPMPSVSPPPASADEAQAPQQPKVQPSPSKEKSASESDKTSSSEPVRQQPKPEVTPTKAPVSSSSSDNALEDIKNKALNELKPLIDEVNLPPEQKFHTILEIISASNDKELIPKLYAAAESIEDKHERAKALVDVVSEIEYLSAETE